jgi:rhodanese-related sulfurtransferase/ABC-type phosphate/phosphonate transport system substrate-binding protein
MLNFIRPAACLAAILVPFASTAHPPVPPAQKLASIAPPSAIPQQQQQLRLMVAVDPSEQNSGFVSVDEISAGLARAAGKSVRALKSENLGDAMRSTRTGEYDIYIAPAHVSASALNHGYELVGSTRPMQAYVLITGAQIKGIPELKDKKLYLSQQDSMASYVAKGMLNEAGRSLKTFKEVMYKKTTGAGLFAVSVGMVDATVAPEAEAQAWLAANPGKGVVLLKSQPVPLGMTVLLKSSLPEPMKVKLAAWFNGSDSLLPGLGKVNTKHEIAPYKYVASLGHFTPAQLPGVKRVRAAEVKDLIAQHTVMVDVRSEKEYSEGHIPGAILVSYGEKSLKDIAFDAAIDSFPGIDKLDKKKPVIFACNGAECWKSYKAAKAAVARGFTTVYWFRGGLPEWKAEGMPVERSAPLAVAAS